MAGSRIDIEDDIKIMNEFVDAELDDIDNKYENYVFCIYYDIEDRNDLLIVTEEEDNYTKIKIMDCLDKIQS